MMKIFALFFIIHFEIAFSQNNGGFEIWKSTLGVDFPTNWNSLNSLVFIGNDTSCKKVQNSHSGNYAALIKPVYLSSLNDTISGILIQSIFFNRRPESFCIFYKYLGSENDSSFILLNFYKGAISPSNSIGNAYFYFVRSLNWTQACSNVNWISLENPDSLVTQISTSFKNKKDSLILDDYELKFNVDIDKLQFTDGISQLFFNQQTNELIFVFTSSSIGSIKKIILRNCYGQEIIKSETSDDKLQVNQLSTGIYYVEVFFNDLRYFKRVIISN